MARRYPPIVTFTPAIARTATSASVPGSIPDARVCRTIAEAGMVPVRIDPTRPDPPHRLNRTDRSIDIDRPDRCSVSTHAPSARPRHRSNGTDAPILIDRSHRYRSHRYRSGRTDTDRSIDRSIATATAGTPGARLTWMDGMRGFSTLI